MRYVRERREMRWRRAIFNFLEERRRTRGGGRNSVDKSGREVRVVVTTGRGEGGSTYDTLRRVFSANKKERTLVAEGVARRFNINIDRLEE